MTLSKRLQQITCACGDRVHPEQADLLAAEALAHVRDALTKAIPDSWLDPLLTGDKAVLPYDREWGCPDIERLLDALRKRLASLLDAAGT